MLLLRPQPCRLGFQTVLDVVVDEFALGVSYRLFHSVELLRQIGAWPAGLDHLMTEARWPCARLRRAMMSGWLAWIMGRNYPPGEDSQDVEPGRLLL